MCFCPLMLMLYAFVKMLFFAYYSNFFFVPSCDSLGMGMQEACMPFKLLDGQVLNLTVVNCFNKSIVFCVLQPFTDEFFFLMSSSSISTGGYWSGHEEVLNEIIIWVWGCYLFISLWWIIWDVYRTTILLFYLVFVWIKFFLINVLWLP